MVQGFSRFPRGLGVTRKDICALVRCSLERTFLDSLLLLGRTFARYRAARSFLGFAGKDIIGLVFLDSHFIIETSDFGRIPWGHIRGRSGEG